MSNRDPYSDFQVVSQLTTFLDRVLAQLGAKRRVALSLPFFVLKPCFHGGFRSYWRVIIRSLSDLDLLSFRIAMKYRTSAGFEAGCRREGVLHELEVNDLAIMHAGKN
jgi:hypothetical protein